MFYSLIRNICTASLCFYYSKWKISGKNNIPDGPVIFVPNHQNAFLDAVLTACSCRKKIWFLTRADVFSSKASRFVLRILKMIPVYRFRDGFSTLRNNARTIDRCVGILNQGESVLIFAEGNHGDRFQLRTLQRGVVKIAELAGRNQNIAVVPVGINYELNRGFRSRVLITFCQPLFTNELITGSEIPFADRLLDEIETRLQNSILHIPEDNYQERYQHLIKNRLYNADPEKQLELDKKVVDTFPSVPEIKNDNVPASAPVINAFANLNLFIPRLITRKWILPHFEDPQFLGPVTWAAGMVVVPLWLACSGILISVFTGRWWTGVIYVSVAVLSIWLLKKNPVPET